MTVCDSSKSFRVLDVLSVINVVHVQESHTSRSTNDCLALATMNTVDLGGGYLDCLHPSPSGPGPVCAQTDRGHWRATGNLCGGAF